MLANAGIDVAAPRHAELELYDEEAVRRALEGIQAVYHLATRIPPPQAQGQPGAWDENDRLRSEASRCLVDAALATKVSVYVQPSVTFVYPPEVPADEDTPVTPAANLGSMIAAEKQCRRFSDAGRQGVVLRLGLLWGPGTASDAPNNRYGATLHVADAGRALLAALDVPAGIYNVVSDGGRIGNHRFKTATGWGPVY